jgi:hypothetical protein
MDIDHSPVQILLEELPIDRRAEIVGRMARLSRPWIRGHRQNHPFQLPDHQTQRLFGFPSLNAQATPFDRDHHQQQIAVLREWITTHLPDTFGFAMAESSHRFLVYQEAAGFPLNFLADLDTPREQYLRHGLAGHSLHVFSEIDPSLDFHIYSPQEFQTLQSAMECFVLGCLFNRIDFRAGSYRWASEAEESGLAFSERERLLLFLANSDPVRERLLRESTEDLENILQGHEIERLATLGGLLALQKRAVYGPLWGRVDSPAELPAWDRLEVAVLTRIEEGVQESLNSHRLSPAALHRLVQENGPDALECHSWLREDGRYTFQHPVITPLHPKRASNYS